jgi:hypothetical protein
MSPKSKLRRRSAYGRRPHTASAWVMALAFVSVSVISFAVDQAVISSSAAAEGRIEFQSLPIAETLAEFNPVRLLESLIEFGSGRSDETE